MTQVMTRSLVERLDERATGADDESSIERLARTVFGVVAADVPFAFGCLATTDPETGLITAAHKSHPLPVGDEDFAASEYGEPDLNQFAEIARRPVPVGVLSIDTDGEVGRCRRLRDYMTPQFGFTDEIRMVCRTQQTTWGLLALYRGESGPSFTQREAEVLSTAQEHIALSIRRVLFADRSPARADGQLVVVIINGADHLTGMSAQADEMIKELGGLDHGSLPSSVLAVATSARSSAGGAQARVPTRAGGWLLVRGVPLDGPTNDGPTHDGAVVITIESAARGVVGQMAIAARGLTSREQDIVALVLRGASTQVIATTLHISPHTVQDHLKAVFTKLDVHSRRDLIAQFILP